MSVLDFDIGVSLLSEYDRDGFLGLQVDGYGESEAGLHPFEAHGLGGFLYRPDDPELDGTGELIAGRACQVLYAMEGGRAHAWCLADPRALARLPQLRKGGAIQFGHRGFSFHLIDGESGSHILYVPYGFNSNGENPTKSCSITINVDNPDAPFIAIVLGDGASIQLRNGEVTLRGGGGTSFVTVGRDSTDVVGSFHVTGGVCLGSEAAGALVLYENFALWAAALEAKVSASVVGPTTVPFATVAALMATKLVKGT